MNHRRAVARVGVLLLEVLYAVTRLGFGIVWNGFTTSRRSLRTTFGRTLAVFLERMGPTYIKLGQILSTRCDLLNPEIVKELSHLQDQLSPISFSVVPRLFKDELGVAAEQVFSELETRPIGSASIASVYRGRLRDGRLVAVKVKRPDAAQRIESDLEFLFWFGDCLCSVPWLRYLPIRPALQEFGACLKRQLDFNLEAEANRRLRVALVWEPKILIPTLVEELCSPSIITMELIDDFQVLGHPNMDQIQSALRASLRALYRMIFVEGFVHCDLHRGNLRFLGDGRAALVDFGFMAELHQAERLKFAEFFYAVAAKNGIRCAEITLETAAFLPPGLNYRVFMDEIVSLVDRVSGRPVQHFSVSDFVTQLFDIQRRHRVVGATAFTMAIVSLLVFEGIAREFDPELDFQQEALPFIFRSSIRRTTPLQTRKSSLRRTPDGRPIAEARPAAS